MFTTNHLDVSFCTVSRGSPGALPGFPGSPGVRTQKVRGSLRKLEKVRESEQSWRKFDKVREHLIKLGKVRESQRKLEQVGESRRRLEKDLRVKSQWYLRKSRRTSEKVGEGSEGQV